MGDNLKNLNNVTIVNRNNTKISSILYFKELPPLLSNLLALPCIDKDSFLAKDIQKLSDLANEKDYSRVRMLWEKIKNTLPVSAHIAICANAITNIINSL
jgi:hypothetical protein